MSVVLCDCCTTVDDHGPGELFRKSLKTAVAMSTDSWSGSTAHSTYAFLGQDGDGVLKGLQLPNTAIIDLDLGHGT